MSGLTRGSRLEPQGSQLFGGPNIRESFSNREQTDKTSSTGLGRDLDVLVDRPCLRPVRSKSPGGGRRSTGIFKTG
jgi:hypothetical protein